MLAAQTFSLTRDSIISQYRNEKTSSKELTVQ